MRRNGKVQNKLFPLCTRHSLMGYSTKHCTFSLYSDEPKKQLTTGTVIGFRSGNNQDRPIWRAHDRVVCICAEAIGRRRRHGNSTVLWDARTPSRSRTHTHHHRHHQQAERKGLRPTADWTRSQQLCAASSLSRLHFQQGRSARPRRVAAAAAHLLRLACSLDR